MSTCKPLRWGCGSSWPREGIEPTNNHAERLLRRGVLWRKNAFGCVSERGCRFVERLLTVVQTRRLQGKGVLSYLHAALVAHRNGGCDRRFGHPYAAVVAFSGADDRLCAGCGSSGIRSNSHSNNGCGFEPKKRSAAVVPSARSTP